MLIGACIGRLVGISVVDIAAHYGQGSRGAPLGVFRYPNTFSWIDPGVFALIGAGAFMGGVTRITVALAVIIMEVSNDMRMLLPVLVGILTAKLVADAFCHPLYTALLERRCVPFLPHEAAARMSLDLVPVRLAMSAPVVMLDVKLPLSRLRAALGGCTHNGFPVVRSTEVGRVLVGVITREHLDVLLFSLEKRGVAGANIVYEELNRRSSVPLRAALPGVSELV